MKIKYNNPLTLFKSGSSITSDDINRLLNSGPYIKYGKRYSYNYDTDDSEPTKVDYYVPRKYIEHYKTGMKDYGRYLIEVEKLLIDRWIDALTKKINDIQNEIKNMPEIIVPYTISESNRIKEERINSLTKQLNMYQDVLNEIKKISFIDTETTSSNNSTYDGTKITYKNSILKISTKDK